MSYCFNPNCLQPKGRQIDNICCYCGASFIIKDRYRSIKLLGKSQLALTIEVADLHQSGCAKVLKILLTNYPKAVALFQQEAMILQQMNCPSIPKIEPAGYFTYQDTWTNEPLQCLVMEKIAGINLEQWLKKQQPLTNRQAINWLKQILEILAQLHQQQYFHRDIKPANIILQPNNKLALIDFGAARKISETYLGKVVIDRGITSIGTPGYMPPEQIDGSALPQSDFFALGRTFVHLLTGKHPQELLKNPDTGELIWRKSASQTSESLADLLDSLMNHLPGKRPPNAATILASLATVEKFPQRQQQFKIPQQIWLGSLLLPLSIFGLFAIGNSINQKVVDRETVPLCNNVSCINRDPIDNGCDKDAQTITSNTGNYQIAPHELKAYRLELRYSPSCNSTWARTEAPPDSQHYVEDRQGDLYGAAIVPVDEWDNHYTDMGLGKDVEIRACAKPPTGKVECTNFVRL